MWVTWLNLFASLAAFAEAEGFYIVLLLLALSVCDHEVVLSRPGQETTIPSCGKCQDWVIQILFWCRMSLLVCFVFLLFYFIFENKTAHLILAKLLGDECIQLRRGRLRFNSLIQTRQSRELKPGLLLSQKSTLISDTGESGSIPCSVWFGSGI